MRIDILFAFLLVPISSAACLFFTLYWVCRGATEIVPGPRNFIQKAGWWYLPTETAANTVIALFLVIYLPSPYLIPTLCSWSGFNFGVLYTDYYHLRHYLEQRKKMLEYSLTGGKP